MTRHLLVAAAVVLLTAAAAAPASASATRHHLALGDSIATGRQAVPADPTQGYVAQLNRELKPALKLKNLACDGETITSMRTGGDCGNQLAAARKFLRTNKVDLITITIGGNDVAPCGLNGIDSTCVANAVAKVNTELRQTLTELRKDAPHARIIGMTLYDPFLAAWLTGPEGQEFARQSVPVLQEFNRALTAAYHRVGAKVADVEGAYSTTDLTTPVELPGFGSAPKAVAEICRLTTMCQTPPDFHPTFAGYTVIKDAYQRA